MRFLKGHPDRFISYGQTDKVRFRSILFFFRVSYEKPDSKQISPLVRPYFSFRFISEMDGESLHSHVVPILVLYSLDLTPYLSTM